MADEGYLRPPEEKPEQERLWRETRKMLDRFLPDLFKELWPEEAKNPISPVKKKFPEQNTENQSPTEKTAGEGKEEGAKEAS